MVVPDSGYPVLITDNHHSTKHPSWKFKVKTGIIKKIGIIYRNHLHSEEQEVILVYLEVLFSKWCPYDYLKWIWECWNLLNKIVWIHALREPYSIVGEEELAVIGQHFLAVNLNDEWFAVPRSDIDGSLFIWREMDIESGAW